MQNKQASAGISNTFGKKRSYHKNKSPRLHREGISFPAWKCSLKDTSEKDIYLEASPYSCIKSKSFQDEKTSYSCTVDIPVGFQIFEDTDPGCAVLDQILS